MDWSNFFTAAGGALVVVIPICVSWFIQYLKAKREVSEQSLKVEREVERQRRGDAIGEWQELAHALQERIKELIRELTAIQVELVECERRSAELGGKLEWMKNELQILKTKQLSLGEKVREHDQLIYGTGGA